MKIGCHVSIAGGVEKAVINAAEAGCETFQLFTQNQRQWKSDTFAVEQIKKFNAERKRYGFQEAELLAHSSYLINMCAVEEEKLIKSRKALSEEIKRCDSLGISYLVIHPGAHGEKDMQWGIETIAETINIAVQTTNPKVQILLETTAGQGTSIGYRFEQLRSIIDLVQNNDKVGVCLDTCHIFAAGYKINDKSGWEGTLVQLNQIIGMDNLKAVHLNDSKKEWGSRRDRHAAIGEGMIGLDSFRFLMNHPAFMELPGILEIPGGIEQNKEDINKLKKMRL